MSKATFLKTYSPGLESNSLDIIISGAVAEDISVPSYCCFAMSVYSRLVPFVLFVPFWAYLVWTWLRQIKAGQGNAPKWRVDVALFGLFAATASTFLSAFLFIHAVATGGYPFYHPVELFCIRVGGLTALLGIIAAIAGKGKVDGHVAVISTLNLLLWIMDAVGQ